MKIKIFLSSIMILTIIFTFSGCKNKDNSKDMLNKPNKINIYKDEKQKQIINNGDKYNQAFFDKVNDLVNIKIPNELSTVESIISENDIKEVRIYAVEFVYDKPQTVTINNGNKEQVQFTEIIFPLSEKWENTAFIKRKDNFYTPIGLNENLDYLVKEYVK